MYEDMIDDIIGGLITNCKNTNSKIIDALAQYALNNQNGEYILMPNSFDVDYYKEILIAHIITLLLDDIYCCVDNQIFESFGLSENNLLNIVDWEISENTRKITELPELEKQKIIAKLISHCFSNERKEFIKELCSQDIISGNTVAKDICEVLRNISLITEIASTSIDEVLARFSKYSGSKKSRIQETFDREYRFIGGLVHNRLFHHKCGGIHYSEKINTDNNNGRMIDYRIDKNACQCAVLHIVVESTNSSGTGFFISDDGYVLTCAHIVNGANNVFANVITGDGYHNETLSSFEVYDIEEFDVVYINNDLDIAILKAKRPYAYYLPLEKNRLLPDLEEEIVVYGYPLGFEMPNSNGFATNISFYKGYVSSNQIINGNSVTYLDINVKSGNSGSPVISTKTGKVIGIVSGIYLGGKRQLTEKIPYMIPIQHFFELIK